MPLIGCWLPHLAREEHGSFFLLIKATQMFSRYKVQNVILIHGHRPTHSIIQCSLNSLLSPPPPHKCHLQVGSSAVQPRMQRQTRGQLCMAVRVCVHVYSAILVVQHAQINSDLRDQDYISLWNMTCHIREPAGETGRMFTCRRFPLCLSFLLDFVEENCAWIWSKKESISTFHALHFDVQT